MSVTIEKHYSKNFMFKKTFVCLSLSTSQLVSANVNTALFFNWSDMILFIESQLLQWPIKIKWIPLHLRGLIFNPMKVPNLFRSCSEFRSSPGYEINWSYLDKFNSHKVWGIVRCHRAEVILLHMKSSDITHIMHLPKCYNAKI